MRNPNGDDSFDDDDDIEIESLPETEIDVECPWCGETVLLTVDPWGGEDQVYTEDCEVCCQPWRVHAHFDADGQAVVVEVQPEE